MNTYSQKSINNLKNKKNVEIIENDNSDILEEYDEIEIEENNNFVNFIDIESYNMTQIPTNVSISTMSLACNLGTLFKTENIYKYMILDSNNIVAVKSSKGMRCIRDYKSKFKSTNKNSKKNFYNQNTIIIKVMDDKYLNIKLFKNGSIQMTGCKQLSDANIAVNKLISKLKEKLMVKTETGFTEITFVENAENLTMIKFKIDLINSNFGVNYLINKENLYKLLTEKNILCRLSAIHSCVNVKYKVLDQEDTYVSIFVFQTGNIIITGAKKAEYVKDAYNYIVQFLNQNKLKIMKKDISKILSAEDFKEILDI
jgi:TATA-box binding protein (TBP) (component of TFIID and TFIIIB)